MNNKMTLSEYLSAERTRQGLSLDAAAALAGVSRITYRSWERGTSAPNRQAGVTALKEHFGVTDEMLAEARAARPIGRWAASETAPASNANPLAEPIRQLTGLGEQLGTISDVIGGDHVAQLADAFARQVASMVDSVTAVTDWARLRHSEAAEVRDERIGEAERVRDDAVAAAHDWFTAEIDEMAKHLSEAIEEVATGGSFIQPLPPHPAEIEQAQAEKDPTDTIDLAPLQQEQLMTYLQALAAFQGVPVREFISTLTTAIPLVAQPAPAG